jgi:hypothetical protein
MPPDKVTIETLQTQLQALNIALQNKQLQADTLEKQVSGLRERLQVKVPADLKANLTAFFDGPAFGMNNSEKADAIIAILSGQ